MIGLKAIEDSLLKWSSDAMNIDVIIAHPNAPRPSGQYATIHVMQETREGWTGKKESVIEPVPPETIRTILREYSGLFNLMVSVNVFRDDAMYYATALRDSVCKLSVKDFLWEAGLAFVSTSDIREITEVIDTKFEDRAQIDFFFHVRSEEDEEINEIKSVTITNQINGDTITIEQS